MKILVTGGAGFLGSHLVTELVRRGDEVTVLDNLYTGSLKNLSHLPMEKVTLVHHDVTAPFHFEVDQIYNLACPASPFHYQANPVFTARTNFLGMQNALELSLKVGARILQASTSEVYGDPEISPQIEEYFGRVNPIGIRSCYDEGKRIAETLCFDYHRQYGVDIRVARIFNTYGPNMALNDGRVVSNFIVQALKNEPITVYGDGNQTRSFCYVSDLIAGLIKLMESNTLGPINLGNPSEQNMLSLANQIISLTNSKSKIVFQELPQDDPKLRNPNIDKAKSQLNWHPEVSIAEGLSQTIKYFREIA